jgi:hypothetical protein
MTQRYKGKKCMPPVNAMREMCIQCMGGRESENYRSRIGECASVDCPIFAFRFGKDPNRRPILSDEQRKRMADRIRKINLARQAVGKSQPNLEDLG